MRNEKRNVSDPNGTLPDTPFANIRRYYFGDERANGFAGGGRTPPACKSRRWRDGSNFSTTCRHRCERRAA